MAFWALETRSPVDGKVGWTVVDDDYQVQPQAAAFLYALRFAGDRAEGIWSMPTLSSRAR